MRPSELFVARWLGLAVWGEMDLWASDAEASFWRSPVTAFCKHVMEKVLCACQCRGCLPHTFPLQPPPLWIF